MKDGAGAEPTFWRRVFKPSEKSSARLVSGLEEGACIKVRLLPLAGTLAELVDWLLCCMSQLEACMHAQKTCDHLAHGASCKLGSYW